MAENISRLLQSKIKELFNTFDLMKNEAIDLDKLYWTEVSTDAGFTAASGTTGVIYDTSVALTKNEVNSALTLIQQFDKFITNQALTQSDYLATIQSVRYGNDPATAILSQAIESFGIRAKQFCLDALEQYKRCKIINDIYFDSELSLAVTAISSQTIVFGAEYSNSEIVLAITLIQNYISLLSNLVATQGDYGATLAKWQRLAY